MGKLRAAARFLQLRGLVGVSTPPRRRPGCAWATFSEGRAGFVRRDDTVTATRDSQLGLVHRVPPRDRRERLWGGWNRTMASAAPDSAVREYAVTLPQGRFTPTPWINVVANSSFGFLVSAEAVVTRGRSTFSRITPWPNDPVSDTPHQAL